MSIVQVSLKDQPEIFDIFYVSVGTLIEPISPVYVHLGGTVKFTLNSEIKNGKSSKWFSSNTDLVHINSETGFARAFKTGKL